MPKEYVTIFESLFGRSMTDMVKNYLDGDEDPPKRTKIKVKGKSADSKEEIVMSMPMSDIRPVDAELSNSTDKLLKRVPEPEPKDALDSPLIPITNTAMNVSTMASYANTDTNTYGYYGGGSTSMSPVIRGALEEEEVDAVLKKGYVTPKGYKLVPIDEPKKKTKAITKNDYKRKIEL